MDKLVQSSYSKTRQLLTIIVFLCLLNSGFKTQAQNKSYPFKQGEKMTYSVFFGWFDIGEAEVWIDPEIHFEQGIPHFMVRLNITSSPWFRFLKPMDMCFESLINVNDLRPTNSFRDIKQGRKVDIRYDKFSYRDSISVEAYIEDIDKHRSHKFAFSEIPFRDALSTYLYLRSRDLANATDRIEVRTFFSNELYEFYIEPEDKGRFNMDGDRIPTAEFKLIFPPSDLMAKGKAGSVIVSADERQIPLKFKVNLNVGSFALVLDEIQYDQ
ncbi:MAG: DUF3108 domain-containing protein [Cyclobacteriaceae bacterium]